MTNAIFSVKKPFNAPEVQETESSHSLPKVIKCVNIIKVGSDITQTRNWLRFGPSGLTSEKWTQSTEEVLFDARSIRHGVINHYWIDAVISMALSRVPQNFIS